MKISIFKLHTLTLLFILISVIGSFLGDYIFRLLGRYGDRCLCYQQYFIYLAIFIIGFIIISFLLLKRESDYKYSYEGIGLIRNHYARFAFYISILMLLALLPLQIAYLVDIYRNLNEYQNLDKARFEFGNFGFLKRAFWYGSFISGYIVLYLSTYRRSLIKYVFSLLIIVELIILLFFGSKSLVLFALLSALLTYRYYVPKKYSVLNILGITCLMGSIIFASTIYNNYRSGNVLLQSDELLIDIFATFMPEQRDGAYLMGEYGDSIADNGYMTDFYNVLMSSVFNKKFYENLAQVSMDDVYQKQYRFKDLLGYKWDGGGARIGMIPESYLLGGTAVCIFTIVLFLVLCYLMLRLWNRGNLLPHRRYFLVLIYLNVIWTFNSSFINTIPFIMTIIWFYVMYEFVYLLLASIQGAQSVKA